MTTFHDLDVITRISSCFLSVSAFGKLSCKQMEEQLVDCVVAVTGSECSRHLADCSARLVLVYRAVGGR